ncbi:MAG: 23S rRNA (adenine(2503)-C(2))-methyltransferase RlmN [Dehalococcoidia bacterium]|nr:23S rRNA (adenine(2503)-C(2))-methyltransferase RlmN [Dehalococcoidia bacterium]
MSHDADPPALPQLLDRTPAELAACLAAWGEPPYRAAQLSRWALARGATSFEAMTDLPAALRARLADTFALPPASLLTTTHTDDSATTKLLLDLGGGAVEAVRMDYDPEEPEAAPVSGAARARSTVCVSTQLGCAMGCVFCATGLQGFTRNLTPAEILAQVLVFTRDARARPVTNVVFMGMGEPLANTTATIAAIRWLVHPDGLALRQRGITVSTVGLRAGIRRLAAERLQVGLTISLHAPDDALRRHLVPTAGGTTIDELLALGREYFAATGRRVTYAYALLAGVNDSEQQAAALAQRLRGERAHVNLVPYNPVAATGLRRPTHSRVRAFQRTLQAAGINATVRIERGAAIAAACGQLRSDYAQSTRTARDGALELVPLEAGPRPRSLS